jgi:hypothetical protein
VVIWTFLSVACTDLLVIYRITTFFWTSGVYVGFGKLLVFESRSYASLTRRPLYQDYNYSTDSSSLFVDSRVIPTDRVPKTKFAIADPTSYYYSRSVAMADRGSDLRFLLFAFPNRSLKCLKHPSDSEGVKVWFLSSQSTGDAFT